MLYAFINDDHIQKIEEAEEADVDLVRHLFQQIIPMDEISPTPQVGWVWKKGETYRDVPDITPRQIRLALFSQGISLTDINNALDSLPEPEKSMAKIQWEYSVTFERRNPLVDAMGVMLGWTSNDLDNLWLYGSTL